MKPAQHFIGTLHRGVVATLVMAASSPILALSGCGEEAPTGASTGSTSTSGGATTTSSGSGSGSGGGGSGSGGGGGGGGEACPGCPADSLGSATGCAGVFNPGQLLTYRLTMAPDDWEALKADTTNSLVFPATLSCNDDAALSATVGVRRKRSGGTDKPGVKIDINHYLDTQTYHGLKKLSLENGISEGSGDVEPYDLLAEYLSWRLMQRSGAMASRAAFAELEVNGALVGVYTNVEQVDKVFLESRIGDDSGWLYKKSGSPDDGYKTNEAEPNPYEQAMCFWDNNPCAAPPDLDTYLPMHLDIDQMLRFGGMNAVLANTDAPLVKDNNYYFYDRAAGPRLYFPWDLDTTQKTSMTLFGSSFTAMYRDVLFQHWEDEYDLLLTGLLEGPVALNVIHAEIDAALAVAGAALDVDPAVVGSTAAEAGMSLKSYWSARLPQLVSELAAH